MKLLLVEDEQGIREFVVPFLQKEGYEVFEADDGVSGLELARSGGFDLLILDLMLPKMDGREVCRRLREVSKMPVLMLTAKSEENDIVDGFEAGADDYLTKPFSPRELTARVKALLARAQPRTEPRKTSVIDEYGPIKLNAETGVCLLDDAILTLTPKEFDLLQRLVRNPGKIFDRDTLMNLVWGYEFSSDARTVDTHIKQLREKLGIHRELIVTVWRKGYKFGE